MPFGSYKNFAQCLADQKARGHSEASAKRICGFLKHRLEGKGRRKKKK